LHTVISAEAVDVTVWVAPVRTPASCSRSGRRARRFNVYVTQPEVKPGCVLRRSNYNVLEKRKLVTKDETESCKRGMNTFAFVGDLESAPEVSCVYHSEQAENQYLENPQRARMGDGRRPLAADAPPPPPGSVQ
jgi:Protein of unknown function (DUF3172)